ncbi:glutamate synthase, NADH/NADPH, small subunit domain protein [Mycobacterium avium MAV_120709_2344]|nr:glutamate synthase, NADH/NADPH, small subunit domain protein [Mycobacterium avium MAV_120709_2344]
MADPSGFLKYTHRELPKRRPVPLRLRDWREVYEEFDHGTLREQATRCMDCGIPFCHNGCPLGNLIPEWNDLVRTGRWRDAIERLHATNNFPDFTGRLCPAPCEPACVLGINQDPVTIKQIELEIIDNAFDEGWVQPLPPDKLTGKKVAVVGSGPAGLAAAQQLTRAGHSVTVFERSDKIGGLLRYGIPEFKMEKRVLDRRLDQMRAEGTEFRAGVNVGVDITADQLRADFDAVVLAGGATAWRDLPIPGRELDGIHQAMEFLPWGNRQASGDLDEADMDADGQPPITAKGKKVIIIGGGDTGADCLGTVHRQGATEVHQFEIMPRPPDTRAPSTPWPTYPLMYRVSSAHEEGGERVFSVNRGVRRRERSRHGAQGARGDHGGRQVRQGRGLGVRTRGRPGAAGDGIRRPREGGPAHRPRVKFTERGNVARGADFDTSIPGVFVAGDMGRGQSLIVWAIAEGRAAAAAADRFLMGATALPAPVKPTAVPLQ